MNRRPMRTSRRRNVLVALCAAFALCLLVPGLALSHAVVFPRSSTTGAYERYVLRVPNEKAVATTRVEIRFPAEVRVTSFADVPGWQLEVQTDSAKRIVGAVWTGTLAPQRFVELPFVAVNPRIAARLSWPTYQTYADGERVQWTGAEGTKTPASTTAIDVARGATDGTGQARWVSWVALVVALLGLGLALRRDDGARNAR